jgi:predicted dehydrogenase
LFARDDIDAVIVATPNDLHAPLAIAAMEAGKHVLVEKPLAHTSAAGREMIAARDRTGRVLMVGFNQRFVPVFATARRRILAGDIGRITFARANWNMRPKDDGKRWQRGDWMLTRERSGGGPLLDLGIHKLDLALFLLGFPRVASVFGICTRGVGRADSAGAGKHYELEDFASGLIRLADGAALQLEAGYFVHDYEQRPQQIVIYGASGGFINGGPVGSQLFRIEQGANVPLELPEAPGWAKSCVEHFAQVLRGETELCATAEQAVVAQEIIEGIYRSAETGQVITMKEQA